MAAKKGPQITNPKVFFLLALACFFVFCFGVMRHTERSERMQGLNEWAEVDAFSKRLLPVRCRLPRRQMRTSALAADCQKLEDDPQFLPVTIGPPTSNETDGAAKSKWRKDWRAPTHANLKIPPTALRWTSAAATLIHGLLQAQQFPATCEATKWLVVEMDQAGLMWNYHAFLRALIIGLQTGRTVIPRARTPIKGNEWEVAAFFGCENLHLGCFFEVTSCRPEDSHRRAVLLEKTAFHGGHNWPFKNATEQEKRSHEEILKVRAFKGWEFDWHYTFPTGLWEVLAERGMVHLEDRSLDVERASSSQRQFMLFAIVSSWLFNPVPRIKESTEKLMARYEDWRPPVVGLHIRRGDKLDEDPYWVRHKQYRPASDYGKRIRSMEQKRGVEFTAVFLASDSASLIDTIAEDPASAALRPEIGVMYDWEKSVSVLENVDEHTHVPSDKKRDLQDKLVATLYAMVQVSEYVVCNLSSNICRFLWSAMGAKKRLEQIAFQGELGSSLDPPDFYSQWEN